MRKIAPVILGVITLFVYMKERGTFAQNSDTASSDAASQIVDAFTRGQGDLLVSCKGKVVSVLPDDTKGSRHQRFIIELENKHTLLVAHNIDLASRVEKIQEGDDIVFSGEYEWNEKGGVIHWTHKDPDGRHPDGWLKHKGITYQ
ncbi:DUF3465 domain-containing protein [Puniceicoccaceae bacterium K14]|nr:DUF3465 domain-containing protein [Puniceicoccaceae bacterium K14]